MVKAMGVRLVSEDEAKNLPGSVTRLELADFDFIAITDALAKFGANLKQLAAIGVAVFDHGDSPPDYSDRQFRFDYLDARIRTENRLSAFAYRADDIPPIMTRLKAVVNSPRGMQLSPFSDIPMVVMDTAPAAVLGATFDPHIAFNSRVMIANVGNFHTLAFRLGPDGIEGVFEHHTGLLDLPKLDKLLSNLANGRLKHADIFDDHGHGALIYSPEPLVLHGADFGVAVTGPRRILMRSSVLHPYFAVPYGDMMIAGCIGLLASIADLLPEVSGPIRESLRGEGGSGTPPWELDE
jgi:uncharacterized protein (DUF1786 family)